MNKIKICLTVSQPEVRALRMFLKRFFDNKKYCTLLLFIDANYVSNFVTILVLDFSSVAEKNWPLSRGCFGRRALVAVCRSI